MAWNRPSESGEAISRSLKKRSGDRFPLKGAIVGTIIVLGVAVAVWLIWATEKRTGGDAASAKKVSLIREVAPSAAATNVPVEKKYSEMTNDAKLKYWKDKYGDNPPDNIKPIIHYLENPPTKSFKQAPREESIFNNHCERQIASLLLVKPGRWMMRPPTYGVRFDADFAQHAIDRIEFTPDDTDEQRALKQAVIDTKKDFIARVKNGEKPSEIMNQAAKELYELGQFKRDLEHEIKMTQKDPEKSDQDIKDFIDAANVMLEKKGLQKLRYPNMIFRKIALDRAAQKNVAPRQPASKQINERHNP